MSVKRGKRGKQGRKLESQFGQVVQFEPLEPRLLMTGIATPDFVVLPTGINQPAYTDGSGLTPSQICHAYGIDQTMFGSVVGDGSGQTIAIVDVYDAPNIQADLRAFDQQFGLPDPTLVVVGQDGSSNLPDSDPSGPGNSWALESSLDVEWAHAIAPQAKIVLVEANSPYDTDIFAAVNTARKYKGVSVVSMSWGGSEFSGQSRFNKYFKTPAHHGGGVTFIASSGDSGAYDSPGSRGVSCPASSAYVLSVGGTTLSTDRNGDYMGESGWGNGEMSYYYGGSGGGLSSYVRRPSYQKKTVPKGTVYRSVPDVSFVADPSTGAAVYDSWDSPSSPWIQIGGTSLSAPMWAGVIAIVNQGRALAGKRSLNGVKQTIPMLYKLPASDFNDITAGNNGYTATSGFDLVTGRGTPIVNLLAMDMAGLPKTTVKAAPAAASPLVQTVQAAAHFTTSTPINAIVQCRPAYTYRNSLDPEMPMNVDELFGALTPIRKWRFREIPL